MWFGGQTLHPALCRRIVRYGNGFHPFGTPTDADLERLAGAMVPAGRDVAELELVGGIRGRFAAPTAVADLDEALADVPRLIERGFTSICFKPSMFTDDRDAVPDICATGRRVPRRGVVTARGRSLNLTAAAPMFWGDHEEWQPRHARIAADSPGRASDLRRPRPAPGPGGRDRRRPDRPRRAVAGAVRRGR